VEDLAVASPATVSRCGMIYVEPGSLTLEPLIKSYVERAPPTFEKFRPAYLDRLRAYCTDFFEPTIAYCKKK